MLHRPRNSTYADRLREFPSIVFGDEAYFTNRGHWSGFFRDHIGPSFDGRIVFEVGCADADFVSRVAAKHPGTAFVGLDWKYKSLYLGAERVAGLGLRNVALLRGRAQDVRRIFADGEVDEIWVFHPDPCDKPNELRNRLIAEPFLLDAHAVLRGSGSTLTLKTDHPGYYQWVLALSGLREPESLRTNPRVKARELASVDQLPAASEAVTDRFDVSMNTPDYWADADALSRSAGRLFAGERTAFEQRFVGKGRPIYAVELSRR